MIELSGKCALVTGASSGIGLCFSKELARCGCNIVAVSNQPVQLHDCVDGLKREFGIEAFAIYADLACSNAAEDLFDKTQNMGIEVDILVNNAGIFDLCELGDMSPQKIDIFISLHITTVTHLSRLYGNNMKSRNQGYIINMSSLSGFMPLPCIAMYVATKSYINTFSQSLRLELKPYGVHVTSICPGGVATDLYSLPSNLQRLGVRLGVLMRPEQLVQKSIRAVLCNKRKVIPGFVNRLFLVFIPLIPDALYLYMKKKVVKWSAKG